MSKVVLTDIENIRGNPLSAELAINANSEQLVDAFENTLSRDGTHPNQMEAQLDMNSYRIINLGAPASLDDAARLRDVAGTLDLSSTNPAGGAAGAVLTKLSTDDYDYDWVTPVAPGVGTVTQVDTGAGLTGGPITGTGTVALNAASIASLALADTAVQFADLAAVATSGDHADLGNLLVDHHTQYHTDARALTWLGTRSTTDLPEGANQYFTVERAQDAIGLTGLADTTTIDLSYNDGAGTISADVVLSAAYAWTGNHTWSVNSQKGPEILGTTPNLAFFENDATANEGRWRFEANADVWSVNCIADNELSAASALILARNGITPETFSLPQDNYELRIGAGNDLRFAHNGTNSVIRNDTGTLIFSMSGNTRMTLSQAGTLTWGAPNAARAIDITAAASNYGVGIQGNTGTGTSFGMAIIAGTNSSDAAFAVNKADNSLSYFIVRGDGVLQINDAGSLKNVTFGANDSGGAGFKALRIAN